MVLVLTFIVVVSLLIYGFLAWRPQEKDPPDFFVGVDAAYDDLNEIKNLVDEVSSYTNLFLVGSTGITHNETELFDLCQFLHDRGLYFIIYDESPLRLHLLEEIEKRWGDHFLGLQYEDELGGSQLDCQNHRPVEKADNYSDAATQFVEDVKTYLNFNLQSPGLLPSDFHLYTSDYALYWFDYQAGYDTIFAEFGWNYSRQLNIALCRGAATVQNKEWGAIITWTYNHPPYIESGPELYQDMVLAYENGAKYVVIFDTNEEYTHGILQQEHLDAIKQFWKYTRDHPRNSQSSSHRVAYVIPQYYAYGFRGPQDKIWGLWEADEFSERLCIDLNNKIQQYNTFLDIVHNDGLDLNSTYSKYIFWNGTTYIHHNFSGIAF
ncbi:MAG: hypothetical protein ACOC6G_02740 [Thermoproteota archaeon]